MGSAGQRAVGARRVGVVHLCPVAGSLLAACCDREIFALPENDRVTDDVAAVTCDPTARRG